MKKCFTLLLFFCGYFLHGQNESFDYKKWTFPIVKIPYLRLNTSYDGRFGNSTYLDNPKQNYNSGNENFNVGFGAFQNDTLWQKSNFHEFGLDYSSYNRDIESQTQYSMNLSTQKNYRYYFDKDHAKDRSQNGYVEFGIDAEIYHRKQSEFKDYGGRIFLPIKVGFGRIEPMNDVFLAQFLTDDLKSNQLIDSSFSDVDILELAKIMSQTRQQRAFDSRRAYIYQINAISKWLFDHNVPNDLRTFNVVNDNWMNANPNPNNRNIGYRSSLGITPFLDHSYSMGNPSKYGGIDIVAELLYSKPISQFWHFNAQLVAGSILYGKQYNGENMFISSQANVRFDYSPTTRTSHSFSSGLNLQMPTPQVNDIQFDLRYESSIFVTNRVRIGASCDIYYRQSSQLDDTKTKFYFLYNRFGSFFNRNSISHSSNFIKSNSMAINWSISMNYILF